MKPIKPFGHYDLFQLLNRLDAYQKVTPFEAEMRRATEINSPIAMVLSAMATLQAAPMELSVAQQMVFHPGFERDRSAALKELRSNDRELFDRLQEAGFIIVSHKNLLGRKRYDIAPELQRIAITEAKDLKKLIRDIKGIPDPVEGTYAGGSLYDPSSASASLPTSDDSDTDDSPEGAGRDHNQFISRNTKPDYAAQRRVHEAEERRRSEQNARAEQAILEHIYRIYLHDNYRREAVAKEQQNYAQLQLKIAEQKQLLHQQRLELQQQSQIAWEKMFRERAKERDQHHDRNHNHDHGIGR